MNAKAEHRRISRERKTVEAMIHIFCNGRHGTPEGTLCPDCTELLSYANARLGRCRYGHKKPTCGNCPVHCYRPDMKERVIEVMTYSGPRMTYRHPYFALCHLMDGFRRVPPRKTPPKPAI